MIRTTFAGLAAVLVLAGCQTTSSTTMPASAPAMGAMNDVCPISGEPVDPSAPTVSYMGHTVGFCCAGCVGRWEKMDGAAKAAFAAKYEH